MAITDTIFSMLAGSENQVIAILASLVLILSGVIVYQWRFTMKSTVPKWIWDSLVLKVDSILDIQKDTAVVIRERLNK